MKQKAHVVNYMMVYFNQIGQGFTALKKFSSVLGMKSLCLKSHQDEERCVLRCIIENTGDVLADSVAKEKEAYMILMKM